jgi:hypothetical protein
LNSSHQNCNIGPLFVCALPQTRDTSGVLHTRTRGTQRTAEHSEAPPRKLHRRVIFIQSVLYRHRYCFLVILLPVRGHGRDALRLCGESSGTRRARQLLAASTQPDHADLSFFSHSTAAVTPAPQLVPCTRTAHATWIAEVNERQMRSNAKTVHTGRREWSGNTTGRQKQQHRRGCCCKKPARVRRPVLARAGCE